MLSSKSKLAGRLTFSVCLIAVASCGSAPASTPVSQPDSAEIEALRHVLAGSFIAEEAFAFGSLEELGRRSSVGVVATIVGIEPGPAENMGQAVEGVAVFNETLAISLVDSKGTLHTLVQDYGEAIGFDAVAAQFPIGATAVLFGVPYLLPERRRQPDKLDESLSSKWQTAHPLGFLVMSSHGVLIPLFSEENSSPKTSVGADKKYLRSLGIDVAEIRWPEVTG